MIRIRCTRVATLLAAAALVFVAGAMQAAPQEDASGNAPQANLSAPPAPQQSAALNASDAVPDGTHFLVRLNDALDSAKDKVGRKFSVTIIEPLETSGGGVLPPGRKITAHISAVDSAAVSGRARIWLAFDNLDTPGGRKPIVAEVSSVPDDGNVKPDPGKEGDIEARHGSAAHEAEVSAAGAAVGAAVGGAADGGRGVAAGAITGGAIAYLASMHYAQEIHLAKGTRIDLVLDRPLYISQQ